MKTFKIILAAVILAGLFIVLFYTTSREHDGKIVKDINGKCYKLKGASFTRYYLEDLDTAAYYKQYRFINNKK